MPSNQIELDYFKTGLVLRMCSDRTSDESRERTFSDRCFHVSDVILSQDRSDDRKEEDTDDPEQGQNIGQFADCLDSDSLPLKINDKEVNLRLRTRAMLNDAMSYGHTGVGCYKDKFQKRFDQDKKMWEEVKAQQSAKAPTAAGGRSH